jgi:hypothetical protein
MFSECVPEQQAVSSTTTKNTDPDFSSPSKKGFSLAAGHLFDVDSIRNCRSISIAN